MSDELDLLYNDLPTAAAPAVVSASVSTIQPQTAKTTEKKAIEFAHNFEEHDQQRPTTVTATEDTVPEDDAPPSTALYVSDLPYWASDADILGVVGQDKVRVLQFLENKVNGKSKGVIYLELRSSEASQQARRALLKVKFSGYVPRVQYVHPKQIGEPFSQTPLDPLDRVAIANPAVLPGSRHPDISKQKIRV